MSPASDQGHVLPWACATHEESLDGNTATTNNTPEKCFRVIVEETGNQRRGPSLTKLEHAQQAGGLCELLTPVQLKVAVISVQLRTLQPHASLQSLGLEARIHPHI